MGKFKIVLDRGSTLEPLVGKSSQFSTETYGEASNGSRQRFHTEPPMGMSQMVLERGSTLEPPMKNCQNC
jgi:hypothetical protein